MTGRVAGYVAVLVLTAGCASRNAGSLLPPPSFVSSPGWVSVTTGSSNAPGWDPPSVWALTTRSNLAALAPFDFPNNLLRLSPDAIFIWAATDGRGKPTKTFPASGWPLDLPGFRLDHRWEGQPAANFQQRLEWVDVRGWHLDVRVYFATQDPSAALLRDAQRELDRLVLP